MSKEIKEILDQLKDSIEYPKFEMPTFDGTDFDYVDNDTLLEPNKCKILLDYITYLQQKEKNNKKALEYLENIDTNYWNLGHKYNVHFDELLEILDKGEEK